MSHIQDVADAYREPISRFIDAAERYCSLIEAWDEDAGQFGSPRDFLQRVEPLLAELYLRALGLPEHHLLFSDEEDEEEAARPPGRADPTVRFPGLGGYEGGQIALMQRLNAYFGEVNYYAAVFDPYGELFDPGVGRADAMPHSLGDDLSSVYDWLKRSLIVWNHRGDEAAKDALFEWQYDFESHAGAHLIGAAKATYWLLHPHAPDDDDE